MKYGPLDMSLQHRLTALTITQANMRAIKANMVSTPVLFSGRIEILTAVSVSGVCGSVKLTLTSRNFS
jgi:hypothetical protein